MYFPSMFLYDNSGDYLLARAALTVKLFLPFALLAAKTLLPFGVDILSRKPCLFLLFLSDGWNVLLLIANIFSKNYFLFFRLQR
ncbi:hypothetical protein ACM44_08900 [Chryseobacterium koreense CCUG 49689]|uniref:Uncharacterized protein n=1 Tax=Chryseobacterium koreense CCUG 49689 TaxID=1304281 RepID=A0A0J7IZ26_9FLAO|nr:hypothetical protein ACM44_08900 [Chryseobacterium koreense CCUG 49689]